jgi:hypothetical protein
MFLRTLTVALFTATTTLLATHAGAQTPLPVPTVGYSADEIVETEAGTITGKVYAIPDRDRSESTMSGMTSVMIIRRDTNRGLMLMPAQKMYREMDFADAQKQTGAAPPQDMSIEAIGPEAIEGITTTKFKLVMKDGSAGGFMWFTPEGIAMKMDLLQKNGKKTERMTMTLKNLQIGAQDPSLFELPAGYTNMGGFAGMKSLGGFGGFGRKRQTGN